MYRILVWKRASKRWMLLSPADLPALPFSDSREDWERIQRFQQQTPGSVIAYLQ